MCRNKNKSVLIKYIILFGFIFFYTRSYCQVTVLEKNVIIDGKTYLLTMQKKEETQGNQIKNIYLIKAKTPTKEGGFIELKSLDKTILDNAIVKALTDANDINDNKTFDTDGRLQSTIKTKFQEQATDLFPEIMVAALRIADYEPIAGEIYINEKIRAYINDRIEPTELNRYKLKDLPLFNDNANNYSEFDSILIERINSLNKLDKQLSYLKDELTQLKILVESITNSSSVNSNDIELLNKFIETIKINSINFDNNFAYGHFNFNTSFPIFKVKDHTFFKTKKNKKYFNSYKEEFNFKINENLLIITLIKEDIEKLQKKIKEFNMDSDIKKKKYINLNKEYALLFMKLYLKQKQEVDEKTKVSNLAQLDKIKIEKETLFAQWNQKIIDLNLTFVRLITIEIEIQEVEIEFNEGFIENITVRGFIQNDVNKDKNFPLEFTNNFPIGFASKKDYDLLSTTRLFEKRNRSGFKPEIVNIALDDIFDYNYNINLNTRDYSPQNGSYVFNPKERKQLTKIQSTKILEAKVYTDLVGLNVEKPNGLIQTEVSRRINIHSRRYAGKLLFFNEENSNIGFMSFIEPTITVSKIESDDRRLPLYNYKTIINNQAFNINYVPMLKLREYQHLSIGTDLNLFLQDIPTAKSTIFINAGFRFGRTAIVDTTYKLNEGKIVSNDKLDEFGVSTVEVFPEIHLKIQPEGRYGINFFYRLTYFNLLNSDILQVPNVSAFRPIDRSNSNKLYNSFELSAFLNPNKSDNGKLFFRYRIFSNLSNSKTNFYQTQFGYSFFLLSNNQHKSKAIE